jgi:hypothetical protein
MFLEKLYKKEVVIDNSEIITLMAREIVNDVNFKIDLSKEMNTFEHEIIDISQVLKVFGNHPPRLEDQKKKLKHLKSKHDLLGDGYLIFRVWFIQKEKEESTFFVTE